MGKLGKNFIIRLVLPGIVIVLAGCRDNTPAAVSTISNSSPSSGVSSAITTPPAPTSTVSPTALASPTISAGPTAATTTALATAASNPTASSNISSTVLSGHSGPVTELAWSPDGKLLASSSGDFSSSDFSVRLWKSDGTPMATLSGHSGPVSALAWSPDGKFLASGSQDHTIRLWKSDGTLANKYEAGSNLIFSLSWSPDSKTLASGSLASPSSNTLQLWQVDSAASLMTLHTSFSGGKFYNVGWSPDGKFLAGGATDYKLWRADGTELFHTESCASCTPAWGFAWAPNSKWWAFGNESGIIDIYDTQGNLVSKINSPNNANTLAWSPDGKMLAGGGIGLSLWRADGAATGSKELIANLNYNVTSQVSCLAWSPDSKTLATGADRNYAEAASPKDSYVVLWDTDGKMKATLAGHTGGINAVSWSPGGKILASASNDKTIRLWAVK